MEDPRLTLFIFLDESGNFDFSPTGSRYWSLTAITTVAPTFRRESFSKLLYSLATDGIGQEYFHATTDRQEVRDNVFRCIADLGDSFDVHSVLADKQKTNPTLYQKAVRTRRGWRNEKDPAPLYQVVGRTLLKYAFHGCKTTKIERIVVILSSIFESGARHANIKKVLYEYLTSYAHVPFHIYFHSTKSDINCQIADYCGWAITIKWERHECRSYDLIRARIKNEFDIFGRGTTIYFGQK